MKHLTLAAAMALLSAPAFADGHASGDAAAGEEQFNRQCVACHVVVNDAGETLAGRNARTGPNLYNLTGRGIAMHPDFAYGDALVEVGQMDGMTWSEENFVAYVQDPTGWLRETLDNRRARGKMAYQVRAEEDALNLYAYLATFAAE
ncbi:c-type cytochrome [Flavimaricola marinus]|uniref:Cytochrome c2 n=1 Tax=Flavimaricola marinus TaxID=1819565 RepID=A0A238LBW1_9RHOB|nr:c-type cytochrome [Flavimaricola marinus]SMY07043.1 Cytochrome c2 [Flavimaricola marinus]